MHKPSNLELFKSVKVNRKQTFIKVAFLKEESAKKEHSKLKKHIGKNVLAESTCRY